jgi:hypothetical protein
MDGLMYAGRGNGDASSNGAGMFSFGDFSGSLPMKFPGGVAALDPAAYPTNAGVIPSLIGAINPTPAAEGGGTLDPNHYYTSTSPIDAFWRVTFDYLGATPYGYISMVAATYLAPELGQSGYYGSGRLIHFSLLLGVSSGTSGSRSYVSTDGSGSVVAIINPFNTGSTTHTVADLDAAGVHNITLNCNVPYYTDSTPYYINITSVELVVTYYGQAPAPPLTGTPTPASGMAADANNGAIAAIWASASSVKVARHLSPSLNIGAGSTGWEATQTLSSTVVDRVSLVYLANSSLLAQYNNSQQISDSAGAAGTWATATSSTANYQGGSVGRALGLSYRFSILGSYHGSVIDGSGAIAFARDLSSIGSINPNISLGTAGMGQRVGGAWVGDKWVALYTGYTSFEANRWQTSTNGVTWTSATVVSSVVDRVASLVLTNGSRVLVGLTWNTTSKKCKAIRSYDKGTTWEQDTVDISAIPAMDTPPMLVTTQEGTYAVWVVTDTPNFVFSNDAGLTWT